MAEESREVVPAAGQSPEEKLFRNLAVQNRTIEGMEGIRPADLGMRPRMLRIIHKVDKAEDVDRGLKPGYLQLGNDACVPFVQVVFLKANMTRVLQEGDGPSARSTCGSANGRVPYEFLTHPKAAECPPCEYSQWETHPQTGKRIPPPCQRAVVFLGLEGIRSPEGPTPFWWVCKKTAFQPAQQFLAELQQSSQVGSMREVVIRIGTEAKKQPGGGITYYVPVFSVVTHEPGQRQGLRKLFDLAQDVHYTHGLADEAPDEVDEQQEPRVIEPEVIQPERANGGGVGGIPF